MILLNDMPIWLLALMIFFLRVIDVTMGTFRTLSVVQGHVKLSVVLGFLEVFIWIFAISQVITRIGEHPLLAFAFAGGFAAGNAVGITLERRIGLGACNGLASHLQEKIDEGKDAKEEVRYADPENEPRRDFASDPFHDSTQGSNAESLDKDQHLFYQSTCCTISSSCPCARLKRVSSWTLSRSTGWKTRSPR